MQAIRQKPRHINFTKANLDALTAPVEGRTYTYDDKGGGLAICTTASGTKTFYVVKKVSRRTERIKVGPWPGLTVEQARKEAAKIVGKIASGTNPNDRRRQDRKAPTLAEVFEEFIELPTRTKAKRPKTARTKQGYRQQFDSLLADWKDRQLSSINRNDVERLHNQLGTDHGFYQANRVLALLKALFNTAIDQGDYNANPAARLMPFEEQQRERFLQADELPRFWAALESEPSEKVRDFVKLALFTGQRRGNVLAMKWADVHLDRAVWTIPQTKTGRHEVPLTVEAIDILKRRHKANGESEYVFPGLHGREHLKDPMRQWREILTRAGIENLRIHDLRRSLGSWQTATGSSLSIVGKTLGHRRPETTAIYSRLEMAPVRLSMEAATAAILDAAQPKKPKRTRKGKTNGKA